MVPERRRSTAGFVTWFVFHMLEAEGILGEAEREVLQGEAEAEVLLGEQHHGAEVPLGEVV